MTPDNNVMRYVAAMGPNGRGWGGTALDIGPGRSANAAALRDMDGMKWAVTTVDILPSVNADFHEDIRFFHIRPDYYRLILDCNTLCHVAVPPYQRIFDGLEAGGRFLSIHPTYETAPIIAEGRWTRQASELELRSLLHMFESEKIHFGYAEYPDPKRHAQIKSWIITADK